jgi:RNA polymerase sigma factor (sigma-70 family)
MSDSLPVRGPPSSASLSSQDDVPVVCLVDDEPAALQRLAALIERRGMQTRCYTRAANLLKQFDPDDFWCVVTDWRMPEMTGLELLQQLRVAGVETPVIVVTAFADIRMVVAAMRAGALTVLEKPCSDDELLAAVEQALAVERIRRQRGRLKQEIRQRFERLSPGERDVIRLALEGKMNREIAAELKIGLRTVEKRRHNAMKKMQAESLAELMRLMMLIEGAPGGG